jgi:hypothetical protein
VRLDVEHRSAGSRRLRQAASCTIERLRSLFPATMLDACSTEGDNGWTSNDADAIAPPFCVLEDLEGDDIR